MTASTRGWGQSEFVKCLLCNPRDLTSDPQHLGKGVHPSAGEAGTGESMRLASRLSQISKPQYTRAHVHTRAHCTGLGRGRNM